MKILQLTTHLNRGGISSYLYNLSRALLKRGHLVFAASSGGRLVSEFEKAGIKHIALPINTKSELSPKLWRSAARLKKIIGQEKIQIIHTHTRVTHCVGWQLSRKTGVHHLVTAHGYYKVRWGRKIFPAWGEKAVAISPAVKEHLLNDFKLQEEKVEMVFTGVDLEKFSPGANEEDKILRRKFGLDNVLTAGMIGRISPEKGHRVFLKAIASLNEPAVKFLLVGSGKKGDESILPFLNDKRIIRIDYLDSVRALKLIDIFVQPSLQEGLGISLLEAMACGKAVVASRIGGIPSVIDEGMDGLLVPPADSEGLAGAILKLVKDGNLRRCLGAAARRKVEAKFDVRKMAERIEKVYEKLLKNQENQEKS